MDIESASFAAYLVAGLLFILALAGLSKHESAGLGNSYGIAGMVVALVATIALAFDREPSGLGIGLMIVAIIVGAAIGLQRAKVVEMTGMHALIALLPSFVGAAAVLVGWNAYLHAEPDGTDREPVPLLQFLDLPGLHSAEVFLVSFVGCVPL